ncbi:MAG: RNA pyrophosphohydrolase [Gammaproteobacteria bacterium]|nr:RNA pyrophosphohydrolase [Gammaproteobacteria bacterium]
MYYTGTKNNLDKDGYRRNVGIIVCNSHSQVLWARRIHHDGWQFPQGGIEPRESAKEAAFRELYEEIGLESKDVKLLGNTIDWLHYDVPYATQSRNRRRRQQQFKGQKQRWFLFKLTAKESSVRLDLSDNPEFDHWQWIDYWSPIQHIIDFKKGVYREALSELEPLLFKCRSLDQI